MPLPLFGQWGGANKCPASCTVPSKGVRARLIGNVQVVCEAREAQGRSGQHLILWAELGHGRTVCLALGRGGCWGPRVSLGRAGSGPSGIWGAACQRLLMRRKVQEQKAVPWTAGALGEPFPGGGDRSRSWGLYLPGTK